MNVLFIGSLYPLERENEIRNNSKGGLDNAANKFQWALLSGLDNYYPEVKVITQPSIRTYPVKYKKIFFKSTIFSHRPGVLDHCLGFINIPLVKHITKYYNLFKLLKKLINSSEKTIIIIYAIHSPYLQAVVDIKKKNDKIKICQIVPDLPHFMTESRNPIYLFFKSLDSILINKCLKITDCFVVLSEKMVDYLNINHKPWIRIEGIYQNENDYLLQSQDLDRNRKIILYTGTLDYRYGIKELLNAFNLIKSHEYSLWICGGGNCMNLVRERALVDKRIRYFGVVDGKKVGELQAQATILINPRNTKGEYNKYSFPSKTIEYFASGIPTLMYRLDGIPEEYFDYCYTIEDSKIESLAEAIYNICQLDCNTLRAKGDKARNFIMKYKNSISQVKKIYEMINKL